jgi:hypothetical protein
VPAAIWASIAVQPHVDIAAVGQFAEIFLALQDDAMAGLGVRQVDRGVEQRLVGNDAGRFDAAGGRDDGLGLAVVDACGEFVCGKSAEDHRVYGAEARRGKHCDHRFGHHRHVDQHAVALADAQVGDGRGERRHFLQQFGVGDGPLLAGDRAVIDDRRIVAPARRDMPVDCVVASVAFRAGEPASVNALVRIENPVPGLVPVNRRRGFCPEAFRIAFPSLIG